MSLAPPPSIYWRASPGEGPGRGPEEPPRKPRRRRTGGAAGGPTFWRDRQLPPRNESFFDRIAPWIALAAMSLGVTLPHMDGFPSLDGREAGLMAAWLGGFDLHRVPGALAALAAALLMYGGLQGRVSRLTAFIAAMLLAASPLAMQATIQANGDGGTLLMAVLALLALARGLDRQAGAARWPGLTLWGVVAMSMAVGDLSVPVGVLGAMTLLWSTPDRARVVTLLRPALALPGFAIVAAGAIWARAPALTEILAGPDLIWGTGLLALPILVLPALPLLAPAALKLLRHPFGNVERAALALICGPLLALLAAPWRGWPVGIAILPAMCLIAAFALDRRPTGEDLRQPFRHPLTRLLLGVWAVAAGGVAVGLLHVTESAPNLSVVISAVAALCVIALGVMWGYQGKAERLALASVLASGLLCVGGLELVQAIDPAALYAMMGTFFH